MQSAIGDGGSISSSILSVITDGTLTAVQDEKILIGHLFAREGTFLL